MGSVAGAHEMNLAELDELGERRTVWLVEGGSLSVVEQSCGPVTEAAYGAVLHGHKIMASADAYQRVLGGAEDDAQTLLERLFVRDADGCVALLSELMDAFDQAGEAYTYLAWSDEGDIAYRSDKAR